MKLKRITLGMGFGDYWYNTQPVEQSAKPDAQPETKHADYIAALIRLTGEQKCIMEQQHAALIEVKIIMKEVKLKIEALLHTTTSFTEE